MQFVTVHARRFPALLAGFLCASIAALSCSTVDASILLPSDESAIRLHEASQRAEFSVSPRSVALRGRGETHDRQSPDQNPRVRWQLDDLDTAFNGAAGASSSAGSQVGGSAPPAAVPGGIVHLPPLPSLTRSIVAMAFFLPEPVPASLLRPPQAA